MDTQTLTALAGTFAPYINWVLALTTASISAIIYSLIKIENNIAKMIIPVCISIGLAYLERLSNSLLTGLFSGVMATGGTAYIITMLKKTNPNV